MSRRTAQSVDCPKTAGSWQGVELNLGGGNDVASVASSGHVPGRSSTAAAATTVCSAAAGSTRFDGGPDNDNIVARDNRAESVECASGVDTAITDDADIRVSCEQVEGDADGDGVRRPADCDDTKPQIRPGVGDVPDDRIDQDCSGADATDLDRDKDGFSRPQDCNDADAAIKPGAKEKPGNAVDENCDREIRPFPPLAGSVANAWRLDGGGTRNVALAAKEFPKGTVIKMRCKGAGCSIGDVRKRVTKRGQSINLHSALGNRRLRPGARLKVSFTRKGRVGRVLRYKFRSGALPDVDFLCRPPGSRARGC